MVKALVFGTKDCAFESHRGRISIFLIFGCHQPRFLLSISAYMLIITIEKDISTRLSDIRYTHKAPGYICTLLIIGALADLELAAPHAPLGYPGNVGFPTRKPRAASFAVQRKYLLGPRAPIR